MLGPGLPLGAHPRRGSLPDFRRGDLMNTVLERGVRET